MKKLIILLSFLIYLLISCSNNSTQPKTFKVGDLIGRWENNNDSSDYFLITTDGEVEADSNKIPINNWYPYEEVTEYKLTAQTINDHFITFYFKSASICTVSSTDPAYTPQDYTKK